MKKYINFLLEKLKENQEIYLQKIINYLKDKSDFDLFEYGDDFKIKKKNINFELIGRLYFVGKDNGELYEKAIRFNFDKEKLNSVDFWENFKFNDKIYNKPNYTIKNINSIINIVDDIIDFINGDFDILKESETKTRTDFKEAPEEKIDFGSFDKSIFKDETNIDIFEAVKLYTSQVAYGMSNSLVVSGLPGLGKTTDIENTLNNLRVKYVPISGDITTSGLYEILFLNRDKLLLFDDMDSVYKSEESINLLKAVLDTKKKRKVSRILKSHFDSFGMDDKKIQKIYNETGKLPKQFEFTGRIIFITNKPGDEMNKALISRSLFVDVTPNFEKIINRINKIKPKIRPEIDIEIKDDVVDFMILLSKKYKLRFPLNLRTFVHCLNIRISNDFNLGGQKAWILLIKQYLIKN